MQPRKYKYNSLNMKKKKLTRAEKAAQPLKEDLKIRVLAAKKKLPLHGISALFFHQFGKDYTDTVKNRSKLNNVLQSRTTDQDITEKLETLVELLNKEEKIENK